MKTALLAWPVSCSILAIIGSTLFCSAQAADSGNSAGPASVSLVSLIVQPERFSNKLVNVVGVLGTTAQGDRLFLSSDDADYETDENAIVLSYDHAKLHVEQEPNRKFEEFDHRRVLLSGTFHGRTLTVTKASLVKRLHGPALRR